MARAAQARMAPDRLSSRSYALTHVRLSRQLMQEDDRPAVSRQPQPPVSCTGLAS
jgi:hypothetical protein